MLKVPLCFLKVRILQQGEEWMGHTLPWAMCTQDPSIGWAHHTPCCSVLLRPNLKQIRIARRRGYYYHDYCFDKSWPLCGCSKEGSQAFLLRNLKVKEIINLVPL